MTDTEKIGEWTRYYGICRLKMNALALQGVLQKIGLVSASDVVKACLKDTKR